MSGGDEEQNVQVHQIILRVFYPVSSVMTFLRGLE